METKQMICIEVEKNDFVFSFYMPVGATYGSAIDASYDVLQEVLRLAKENAEKARPESPAIED